MKMNSYFLFFKKLANPLRIKIICSLKRKEKSVSDLSKELKVEQSKLSHALKELLKCHIVDFEKKGKKRFYKLNKETILPILKLIDKHKKKFCKKCEEK